MRDEKKAESKPSDLKVYDDGGDFNDYIEALEDNGGKNTTEIT